MKSNIKDTQKQNMKIITKNELLDACSRLFEFCLKRGIHGKFGLEVLNDKGEVTNRIQMVDTSEFIDRK